MQLGQEQHEPHSREYLRSLVLALYRVTAQLPPNDILRVKLREEGLNIISHAEHMYAGDHDRYRHFVAAVQTLIHFCEIAEQEGVSDSRNFEALKHAFFQVRNAFEKSSITNNIKPKLPFNTLPKKQPVERKKEEHYTKNYFIPRRKSNLPLGYVTKRQRKLLDHLKQVQTAQASDFINLFPNISSRTIRRDLDALSRSGQLVKDGRTNGTSYHFSEQI